MVHLHENEICGKILLILLDEKLIKIAFITPTVLLSLYYDNSTINKNKFSFCNKCW